jgi:hypothetical protein
MISHPSRYDCTYLVAALHRLAELAMQIPQQQQQVDVLLAVQAVQAVPAGQQAIQDPGSLPGATPAVTADGALLLTRRLARKLMARLLQLLGDATAAELACTLAAAVQLSLQDGKLFAATATRFADPQMMQQATDAQVASVMFAVASYHSSTAAAAAAGGGGPADKDGAAATAAAAASPGFSRHQQLKVLTSCANQLAAQLAQQQRQQRQQQQQQQARHAVAPVAPASVVTAVWSLAAAGCPSISKAVISQLFELLQQPIVITELIGTIPSSSSRLRRTVQRQQVVEPEVAARNCCSVVWAAAELGYTSNPELLRVYVDGFMNSMPAVPVTCNSILTVLQALAAILAAEKAQQQQQQQLQSASSIDYWRSAFLRCTGEALHRIQQQQQQLMVAGHAAPTGSVAAVPAAAVPAAAAAASHGAGDVMCGKSAASQLSWLFQVGRVRPPDGQLEALLTTLQSKV